MAEHMQVFITDQGSSVEWGHDALISAGDAGLTVHRGAVDDETLRRIQQAGRRISMLGIEHVALAGRGWKLEYQWAFGQGYSAPHRSREITWAELSAPETEELVQRTRIADWVRRVTNATPEQLGPRELAEAAAAFLSDLAPGAIKHRIVSGNDLRDAGLVGIHGVGRGSERPPVLLELHYAPAGAHEAPVAAALVGKGITFDSGGYSIKPSEGMLSMKSDMGGAAMVTGGLALAIARGLDQAVLLYLCCAENLISGNAYKLGDILHFRNDVSVEIVNTDAEGRLVLADGLILAAESGAPLILDAGTLTGAAQVAVGDQCNAIFSFDHRLRNRVLDYADLEAESFWPLPLERWHRNNCPSAFADTANSVPTKGGGPGGASNAAAFLSRFVPDGGKGWAHMDLAAAFQKRSNAMWSAGATAMGIRTIARTLLEETR